MFMIALLCMQPFKSLDTQHRHEQRTAEMGNDDRRSPRILSAQQHRDRLCREGGKSSQSAEKAGDDEQPPFRRKSRVVRKKSHREADQITADQIGRQCAYRQLRQGRIEPQPQAPAQPCAECRTYSYCEKSVKGHKEIFINSSFFILPCPYSTTRTGAKPPPGVRKLVVCPCYSRAATSCICPS